MPEPDYRLRQRRARWAFAVVVVGAIGALVLAGRWPSDDSPTTTRTAATATTVRMSNTTVRPATTTRRATSEAECRRTAGGIVADNQAFMDSLAGMQASLLADDLAGAGMLYGWADSELFVLEASFDEFRDECRSHFPEETRRAEALLRDMRGNWAEATRVCRETLEPLGLAIC